MTETEPERGRSARDDVDVVDEFVCAVLELAARKLVVPSWPSQSPLGGSPDVPTIEARRDDEGALGVFRFATVVADDAAVRAAFDVRVRDARALDASVALGDEIGIELPLPVVCAVAVADLDAGLEHPVFERLRASGLTDAVVARLRLLRGPPPSSPELSELRAVVSRYGGMAVRWTLTARADADAPDRLVCCVDREDVSRLVVVEALRGSLSRRRLLAALLPPPPPRSLWRLLEAGAFVVGVDAAVAVVDDGAVVSAVVDAVAIDADPARYGQVEFSGHVTRTREGRVVSSSAFTAKVDVDVGALVDVVDDAAAARVDAAARVWRARLASRLLVDGVVEPFAGTALLRVLGRAARGSVLAPRAGEPIRVVDDGAGAFDVDVFGRVVKVVPADDAIGVVVKGAVHVVADGRGVIDGDVEALHGVCVAFADAVAGTDADVDLVFIDGDVETTQTLSAYLRSLATRDALAWVPGEPAAARVWQEVVDCVLEER